MIMKKNYLKPNTDICEMQLATLMAGSVNSISAAQAGSGDEDTPVNFGRSGSNWDDED